MVNALRLIALLISIGCTDYVSAQVVAELVYPVIPIRDDCHYVFDDTSTVRVISKTDFQQIDKLWHTKDFCFEQPHDTIYFKSFEVIFENLLGQINGFYPVYDDGHLQSEYQSALLAKIRNIKPYTKVHFQNVQFENDGALHQVPNFMMIIDSIVEAEFDSCFSLFSIPWQEEISLSKDSILNLFDHHFCVDTCSKTAYWPDNNIYTYLLIGKYKSYSNPKANTYESGPSLLIDSKKLTPVNREIISALKQNDLVVIEPMIYQKEETLFKTRNWRFKIVD